MKDYEDYEDYEDYGGLWGIAELLCSTLFLTLITLRFKKV
jgi:hypothetical protein